MSETKHPWCRDVSRDEAIRAAEDDAANWRRLEVGERIEEGDEFLSSKGVWCRALFSGDTVLPNNRPIRRRRVPLPDHRDLPAAVAELRERMARLEEVIPKSVSVSNSEAHENKVGTMPANGLRTERVTLEITLSEAGQRALAMVGEMLSRFPVRVVEALNEFDVAGMEYRGNSVGYWYAKAESYGQVVRDCRQQLAARNGETLAQAAARLTAERDAALRERDAERRECERRLTMCESMKRQRDSAQFNVSCLKARVAELESAAKPAPAANAGGEQPEPPRGWLTEEERRLIERLKESSEAFPPSMKYIDDVTVRDALAMYDALLARSTPRKVRRPGHRGNAKTLLGIEVDCDNDWIAAIREAGGEVQDG